MINVDSLISVFQLMYKEHWKYEWGAARKGVVDCSGAFVYAYKKLNGPPIEHSSNAIARKYVGAFTKDPVPGYAAFKWRPDSAGKTPARWKDGKGDYYHVGLVDDSGKYVLNAKGTNSGFCRDPVSGWYVFAPLNAVNYDAKEGRGWSVTPYNAIVDVTSGRLRIRSGPSTEDEIVESVPKDTPVVVLAEFDTDGDGKADWAFVDEDGTQGYASMRYLKRTPEPVEVTPSDTPEKPDEVIGVFIPCDSLEEAFKHADGVKDATIVRLVKPPGTEGRD